MYLEVIDTMSKEKYLSTDGKSTIKCPHLDNLCGEGVRVCIVLVVFFFFFFSLKKLKVKVPVTQLGLYDPMDYSLPDSSVHGIL